ncbi:MAG: hypothetical protein IPP07_17830 [Holophagales bacterium]|nr:hypothetical protein [Holophagales bacterium]
MYVPFPGATWFERVAIRDDGFGFAGDPNVHVPWTSVTLVGAVHEIDSWRLSDYFFWAIICDPAASHIWVPMPIEGGLDGDDYSAFEAQLKARAFAVEPPAVSAWHETGKGYDRSYLSFCTFPVAAYGQPLYQYRRTKRLFSLPRLFTVVPSEPNAA